MALVAGSVTVNPDGTYSATGFAKVFMDGEVAALYQPWLARASVSERVETLERFKLKAEVLATGIVEAIKAGTITIEKDKLDSGVPSVDRNLAGAIG